MIKKASISGHIYILAILLVAFFAILIMSTSLDPTNDSYDFKDEITLNSLSEILIGSVISTNEAIFPKKVKLKNLIGCVYEGDYSERELYIDYRGQQLNYGGYSGVTYELSSNSNKKLDIYLNYLELEYKDLSGSYKDLPKEFDLYIFENGEDESLYRFCQNIDKNKALKIIKIIQNEESTN